MTQTHWSHRTVLCRDEGITKDSQSLLSWNFLGITPKDGKTFDVLALDYKSLI